MNSTDITRSKKYLDFFYLKVYHYKLYGEGYLWFMQNWHDSDYHNSFKDNPSNCTMEQLLKAVNNSLVVWYLAPSEKNTLNGMVSANFQQTLTTLLCNIFPPRTFSKKVGCDLVLT